MYSGLGAMGIAALGGSGGWGVNISRLTTSRHVTQLKPLIAELFLTYSGPRLCFFFFFSAHLRCISD